MGKRKKSSRKPTGPKKREPLATSFKCVFCSNETSVTVAIDKKTHIGTLNCRACGQNYQSVSDMKALMAPVDVYYEWIDACEEVAKDTAAADNPAMPPSSMPRAQRAAGVRNGAAPGEKMTEEDARFIDDTDDVDAEAEYAD
ncbi:hypothetical protein BAUCODRAFT_33135, partial [Baudoinia panamericana UAMH 10762]